MKKSSFHILRVRTAITFLWIGVLIFKTPEAWGGYLEPWTAGLLLKLCLVAKTGEYKSKVDLLK